MTTSPDATGPAAVAQHYTNRVNAAVASGLLDRVAELARQYEAELSQLGEAGGSTTRARR